MRFLNFCVWAFSSSSVRFWIEGSSAFICSTIGLDSLRKRSELDPKTFLTNLSAKLFTVIYSSSESERSSSRQKPDREGGLSALRVGDLPHGRASAFAY